MAEKILNTRIQLKYDTLGNWNSSTFILKKGEIAIVEVPTAEGSTLQPVMFKVGNGEKKFSELDWASAKAADVYAWAKKSGIEVEDNGTGSVVSDIAWDETKNALVITRIDVYTKAESDAKYKVIQETKSFTGSTIKTATGVTQDANGVIGVTFEDIAFPAPVDISGKKDKQDAKEYTGSTIKTITSLKQDENGVITEAKYEDIAFPSITITEDADAEVPVNDATVNVYKNITANGHVLTEELVQVATAKGVADALAEAKKYADDNDANETFSISYSDTKIKLIGSNGTNSEIDATAFIKDGMIESVALSEDGLNLVITWNTDSDKGQNNVTTIPLSGLVDVYTGVDGTTIKVDVSSDNKIGAEVKTNSIKDGHIASDAAIAKSKLASDVQASLDKADSALQEHQDISGKANKVTGAVAGNFAGLNADGDLTDSGVKASDFAPADIDTGVHAVSLASGTNNGTLKLTVDGTATDNIAVTGLGSAAYTDATAYATATQGGKADTALQSVAAGDGIKVTTKEDNSQTISINDDIVWVFDCGNASDKINPIA